MIKKILSINYAKFKGILLIFAVSWFVFINVYFYTDLFISRSGQMIHILNRILGF